MDNLKVNRCMLLSLTVHDCQLIPILFISLFQKKKNTLLFLMAKHLELEYTINSLSHW